MVRVNCGHCGIKESTSKGVELMTCLQCKSVCYCSKKCQRLDWKQGHKYLCPYLNVGDAEQVRTLHHTMFTMGKSMFSLACEENYSLDQRQKRFFQLFWDSCKEENLKSDKKISKMAREMKRILLRVSREKRDEWFFTSVITLIHDAPTELLDLPTCPINILLPLIDPRSLSNCNVEKAVLHSVAVTGDPFDERLNQNVVVSARKLLAAGANVNKRASKESGETVLHLACDGVTKPVNLDLIKLLLKAGADPNAKRFDTAETPLIIAVAGCPSAAKFLLEYTGEKIDVNATTANGISALGWLRFCINHLSQTKSAVWKHHLNQMEEVESLLVSRGAVEAGSFYALNKYFQDNQYFWLGNDNLLAAMHEAEIESIAKFYMEHIYPQRMGETAGT